MQTTVSLANCYSSRCWKVIEPSAVLLPAESIQRGLGVKSTSGGFLRRIAVERAMDTMIVEIGLKVREFPRQVGGIPEKRVVEIFPADCPDQ